MMRGVRDHCPGTPRRRSPTCACARGAIRRQTRCTAAALPCAGLAVLTVVRTLGVALRQRTLGRAAVEDRGTRGVEQRFGEPSSL